MHLFFRQSVAAPLMATLLIAPAARADDKSPTHPAANAKAFSAVVECRRITDPAARLACYDNNVAQFETAVSKRDIVVVEKEEVQKTRRSLFGFATPSMRLLGSDEDSARENQELTATIRSAHRDRDGLWVIQLDEGAIWHQTDGQSLGDWPRPGMTVLIRRGTLGSFIMRVGKQPGFKVRREG